MTEEGYKKTFVRMLDSVRSDNKGEKNCYGIACYEDDCPFFSICHNVNENKLYKAFDAIKIVEQWAQDHPVKTNEERFLEVFGDVEESDAKFNENWLMSEYKYPKKEDDINA